MQQLGKLVLLKKCGEADSQEQRLEKVTKKIAGGRRQVSANTNEWTFSLDPTHFMRILIFRNGELVDISTAERRFQFCVDETGR